MGRECLLQRFDNFIRGHYLTDRNSVKPDYGFLAAANESGRNGAEPLAQARPVLAVPQHLQQPVGQRQHQEKSEQRTVKHVHEGSLILNGGTKFDSLATRQPGARLRHPIIHVCITQFGNNHLGRPCRAPRDIRWSAFSSCSAASSRLQRKNLRCPQHSPLAPIPPTTTIPWKKLWWQSIPMTWRTKLRSSASTTATLVTCRSSSSSRMTAINPSLLSV